MIDYGTLSVSLSVVVILVAGCQTAVATIAVVDSEVQCYYRVAPFEVGVGMSRVSRSVIDVVVPHKAITFDGRGVAMVRVIDGKV